MATLGFELRREDHVQNASQWSRGDRCTNNASHSSSGTRRTRSQRDYYRGTSASASLSAVARRYGDNDDDYGDYEDEHTSSYFSDDTSGVTTSDDNTETIQRQRKRKCAVWMMAVYTLAAAITFCVVLLWRLGVIFNKVDESMNSLQDYSNMSGYDEQGRMLCNGLVLNCFRRANEIMYATVHNAMSSRDDGFLAYNNLFPLEDALEAGFRALAIDSCDCARVGIQLCHGVCVGGFRRPLATFATIVKFMTENVHEVVIIEIQVGQQSLWPLFEILDDLPMFAEMLYQHPGKGEPWPTLKDMIEMNKRLVIFQHDDISCQDDGKCPIGVHNTFDYAFETPFSQKGIDELMDFRVTCDVSRGWSNSDFVISNHFATDDQGLPTLEIASQANTAENLRARINACQEIFKKYGQEVINFLVVDFWNVGAVLEVVHDYNSALPPKTEAPSEVPSSAPTQSLEPSYAPTVDARVSVKDVLLSSSPSSFPTTMSPTNTPSTNAPSTSVPTTSFPTIAPTKAPQTITANPPFSMDDSLLGQNNDTSISTMGSNSTEPGLSMSSTSSLGDIYDTDSTNAYTGDGLTPPFDVFGDETDTPTMNKEPPILAEEEDTYGSYGHHSVVMEEKDPIT